MPILILEVRVADRKTVAVLLFFDMHIDLSISSFHFLSSSEYSL